MKPPKINRYYNCTDLNLLEEFNITHVRREWNKEADKLSNWVLSFERIEEIRIEDFWSILRDDLVD